MAITSLKSGISTRSGMAGNTLIYPGSYESIASTTVGAGGVASITFDSIPQTYTHLEIRWIYRATYASNGSQAYVYFNDVRNGQYALHTLRGGDGGTLSQASTSLSETYFQFGTGSSQTANVFGAGVNSILDYTNTNKNKTMRGLGGYNGNGNGIIGAHSGLIPVTAAITKMVITPQDGNFVQYSQFALYGIA